MVTVVLVGLRSRETVLRLLPLYLLVQEVLSSSVEEAKVDLYCWWLCFQTSI